MFLRPARIPSPINPSSRRRPVAANMTPDKTRAALKGATVYIANKHAKEVAAAAAAAGAHIAQDLTPNVDILVGDDDNQLTQEAEDKGVDIWSESELLTAAAGAPPPPPPPPAPCENNALPSKKKTTIYVRRFPALPGDVTTGNGLGASLAYSWYAGSSAAEIELGLRQMVGAGPDEKLRLLDSRGYDVPISPAVTNGLQLTLQLVPTTPSAPPANLVNLLGRHDIGPCTASPRRAPRQPTVRSPAIQKRRRDANSWWIPTEDTAAAGEPPHKKCTTQAPVLEAVEVEGQDPLEEAVAHEEAVEKLASEAAAMKQWAAAGTDTDVEDDGEAGDEEEQAEQADPESEHEAAQPDAAAGKAKLRKIVDQVATAVKTVAKKISAVQKTVVPAAATPRRAAAGCGSGTAAVRSARKQAERWLPSRAGRAEGEMARPLFATSGA